MRVLYFAWVRQKVGTAEDSFGTLPQDVCDVGGLMKHLAARGGGYAEAFGHARQIRAAVNQEFAGPDHPVRVGDEVAFFPPVTGG
ncbi:MAG TPA: molybdopterin converting factor subunit 1 [Acetobacteraceae bacterium]|nr:molybdopterin converting factor subunit 1 [Acetobacteraceae bacterium]